MKSSGDRLTGPTWSRTYTSLCLNASLVEDTECHKSTNGGYNCFQQIRLWNLSQTKQRYWFIFMMKNRYSKLARAPFVPKIAALHAAVGVLRNCSPYTVFIILWWRTRVCSFCQKFSLHCVQHLEWCWLQLQNTVLNLTLKSAKQRNLCVSCPKFWIAFSTA